jgi:hypothetical protein
VATRTRRDGQTVHNVSVWLPESTLEQLTALVTAGLADNRNEAVIIAARMAYLLVLAQREMAEVA